MGGVKKGQKYAYVILEWSLRNTTNLESVFTSMTLCNEWNHHENIHCVIVNNKYAFTSYIRKWVSDKKSDRQKAAFSVHTGW